MDPLQRKREQDFIRLLTESERDLSMYLYRMVPFHSDAQDIMQNARLILWENFDRFEPGTNFGAWARKTIFHQVLAYRKKSKRSQWLSAAALEKLSHDMDAQDDRTVREAMEKALKECIGKLKREQREIIGMRYWENASIEKIAERCRRTEGAVYRLLSRLRHLLFDCVQQKMNAR